MLRKLTAMLLVLALVGIFSLSVGGCGDKDDSPATMDDYRKEAEKTITTDNAEVELDKAIKEIDADIKAETE